MRAPTLAQAARWAAASKHTLIAAVTVIAAVASYGLLPAPWDRWAAVICVVANVLGVHVAVPPTTQPLTQHQGGRHEQQ